VPSGQSESQEPAALAAEEREMVARIRASLAENDRADARAGDPDRR
jgi:hypothetical protein